MAFVTKDQPTTELKDVDRPWWNGLPPSIHDFDAQPRGEFASDRALRFMFYHSPSMLNTVEHAQFMQASRAKALLVATHGPPRALRIDILYNFVMCMGIVKSPKSGFKHWRISMLPPAIKRVLLSESPELGIGARNAYMLQRAGYTSGQTTESECSTPMAKSNSQAPLPAKPDKHPFRGLIRFGSKRGLEYGPDGVVYVSPDLMAASEALSSRYLVSKEAAERIVYSLATVHGHATLFVLLVVAVVCGQKHVVRVLCTGGVRGPLARDRIILPAYYKLLAALVLYDNRRGHMVQDIDLPNLTSVHKAVAAGSFAYKKALLSFLIGNPQKASVSVLRRMLAEALHAGNVFAASVALACMDAKGTSAEVDKHSVVIHPACCASATLMESLFRHPSVSLFYYGTRLGMVRVPVLFVKVPDEAAAFIPASVLSDPDVAASAARIILASDPNAFQHRALWAMLQTSIVVPMLKPLAVALEPADFLAIANHAVCYVECRASLEQIVNDEYIAHRVSTPDERSRAAEVIGALFHVSVWKHHLSTPSLFRRLLRFGPRWVKMANDTLDRYIRFKQPDYSPPLDAMLFTEDDAYCNAQKSLVFDLAAIAVDHGVDFALIPTLQTFVTRSPSSVKFPSLEQGSSFGEKIRVIQLMVYYFAVSSGDVSVKFDAARRILSSLYEFEPQVWYRVYQLLPRTARDLFEPAFSLLVLACILEDCPVGNDPLGSDIVSGVADVAAAICVARKLDVFACLSPRIRGIVARQCLKVARTKPVVYFASVTLLREVMSLIRDSTSSMPRVTFAWHPLAPYMSREDASAVLDDALATTAVNYLAVSHCVQLCVKEDPPRFVTTVHESHLVDCADKLGHEEAFRHIVGTKCLCGTACTNLQGSVFTDRSGFFPWMSMASRHDMCKLACPSWSAIGEASALLALDRATSNRPASTHHIHLDTNGDAQIVDMTLPASKRSRHCSQPPSASVLPVQCPCIRVQSAWFALVAQYGVRA